MQETGRQTGKVIIVLRRRRYIREKANSIRYRITDSWDSGYNVSVEIDNISDSTIGNWVLECNPGAEITNIWNATAEKNVIGAYIIKNAVWNMDIASGSKAEFGFTANGSPRNGKNI